MPDGGTVIYRYDGSFEGLLCCVFESYEKRELPVEINGPEAGQMALFPSREIETDPEKARRVQAAIPKKIGKRALDFVYRAFLTCLPAKERYLLLFLRMGFAQGEKVMKMLSHDVVNTLDKAVRNLGNEAHLLTEFLRFSDYGGVLAAEVRPKNFVLPFLGSHFVGRFPDEQFLIYDRTHAMALTYEARKVRILPVEEFQMPAPGEEELRFRALWKKFYDTIGIKERYNPKCRRTMMPKRYWENMTEFADCYRGKNVADLPLRF